MTFIAWFEIVVGAMIVALWIALLVTRQVPVFTEGREDIWFDLAAAQALVLDRGEHLLDVLRGELGQADVADVGDDVGAQGAAVADDGGVADGAGQGLGEPPLEVLADFLAVVAEAAAFFEGALGLAVLVAHLRAGAGVQVLAAAFAVVPPEMDDGDPGPSSRR